MSLLEGESSISPLDAISAETFFEYIEDIRVPCRGSAQLFFEEQQDLQPKIEDRISRAQAICAECIVREVCLEGALLRKEPHGIWGGKDFYLGKIKRTRANRE